MSEHPDANRIGELGRGTARIVSASALRQVLWTGLAAATAAVVARALGAADFGLYAGGTAAFYLALSLTDLGFAVVLARELATRPGEEGRLLRATAQVQLLWSGLMAAGLLVTGVVSGGTRGEVMLVLAPAVVISGLSSSRQIFSVRYRPAPLLALDITTALVQAGTMIALAAAHSSPVGIAIGLSASISLNAALAALLAHRAVGAGRPRRGDRAHILRMALPVGIASVLASLYFTIDQVLLGWLVSSRELGQYAAAVRFLTAVVAIPGLVMAAGVPGLARTAADREQLSRFAGTLAHWLAVTALPLAIALAVFARPAVRLVFGGSYTESIPLLRVLMVAGVLSLGNNILSIVLMSLAVVRAMVAVNLLSLAVNVAGNLTLVPHYGVTASAWLTVASEAIVIVYGLAALRHRLSYRLVLSRSRRALLVAGVAGGIGLALGPSHPYAFPAAVGVFAVGLLVLRAWPAELLPERWRWLAVPQAVR
jgi:O-antigen/teichoic acid export membrane protein